MRKERTIEEEEVNVTYVNSRLDKEKREKLRKEFEAVAYYKGEELEIIETDFFSPSLAWIDNSWAVREYIMEKGRTDLLRPL